MGSQEELKLIISAQDKTQQAILSTSNGLKYLEGTITKLSIQFSAFTTAWNQGMAIVQKAMQYIDLGAQAIRAEEAYAAMADAADVNAERLTASMKKAADGFVDDSHLMQKAAFAMAQDIVPEKIPQLFEAARVFSRKTGQDVTSSIDGMIQGISTNMPRSLRQMGMITKEQMTILNQAMAAGIDEVNLLDLVLANAAVDSAKFGTSANNAAKDVARFKVQCEELKEEAGKLLIAVLQRLIGLFQSLAASVLGAAAAYHSFRAAMLESDLEKEQSLGWPYGDKDRISDLKRKLEEQKRFAKEAREAALGLAAKSYDNVWGGDYTDTRTKEQKEKDIAAAEARRAALDEDLKKRIAAAKGKEKAAKLREEWESLNRQMEADIAGAGLEEFEKKLIAIEKKAEELRAKEAVKKAPGGAAKVGLWAATMEEEAASEQAKKDFETWFKTQNDIEKVTKEFASRRKAIREGEINDRLAALDMAEKEGTFHRDTLEERIRLTQELVVVQREYLDTIDKEKDPASWYAQVNAINQTRLKLLELKAEQRPVFEGLRRYADEATDVWKNVGNTVRKVFDGMTDALTDFVVDGKFKFADFANSVIRDLVRIAIQQQITGPLASNAGSFFGDLFGSNSLTTVEQVNALGGGFHLGGNVGGPAAFYRLVPAAALLDALPRRHGGGLATDERLVINKVNERYISEEQNEWLTGVARAMSVGGKSGGDENHVHVHMTINAMDSQSVSQQLAKHKAEIVGMVNQAFNKIGKRGPLGS